MGVAQAETATQLYAVVEAGEAALDRLTAALSAAEFASMLILPPAGGTLDAAMARPLIEAAQEKNVAALIADDAQLARTLRADGVHLSPTKILADAYAEARSILGRVGIVGVDPGISRHDAMTLAEDGADYVAFGAPPNLKDRDKGRERRDELIAWWAEIFQAPCVAFDVETPEEAAALARAGADFVSVRLPVAATPAATRDLVAAFAATLRASAPAG
jgi:thiamine-phosphate pyrophosphorylase